MKKLLYILPIVVALFITACDKNEDTKPKSSSSGTGGSNCNTEYQITSNSVTQTKGGTTSKINFKTCAVIVEYSNDDLYIDLGDVDDLPHLQFQAYSNPSLNKVYTVDDSNSNVYYVGTDDEDYDSDDAGGSSSIKVTEFSEGASYEITKIGIKFNNVDCPSSSSSVTLNGTLVISKN